MRAAALHAMMNDVDEQPPPISPDPAVGAAESGGHFRASRTLSRRFMDRYERRRRERETGQTRFFVRPLRILTGVILVAISPLVGAIPGPGGVMVFLPGAFLLASEVRRAAIVMDRLENETLPRLRRLRARFRGGPKAKWVAQDPHEWAEWCERRNMAMPDSGDRRRADDQETEDTRSA